MSSFNLKNKTPEEINKILGDAWLNIMVDEDKLFNPLSHIPEDYKENPNEYIMWLMTRPEYFSFICSEILNVDLLPFQAVLLEEFWNRKFPIYIATRGLGKLLRSDELIRVKNGWKKMEDINVGDKVYGSDGKLTTVINKTDKQTDVNMYKITLRDKRTIECCEDHQWKVFYNNKWCVLKTKEMVNNFNKVEYSLPVNKPLLEEDDIELPYSPTELAYLINKKIYIDRIPVEFKNASYRQKIELLRHIDYSDQFLSSKKIYEDIQDIERSCGIYDYDKIEITNIESIGKGDGYCIQVDNEDSTYLTKDYIVTHNSFLLAVYGLLRALLLPKRKVVICGASFRQSKVIYEYMSNIWYNSPLLRDMVGGNNFGPKAQPDMCRLTLRDSMITALPIGCLSLDTLITTDEGIRSMGSFSEKDYPKKIWSKEKFEDVGFFFDNGFGDCKKITTEHGYSYTGTPNHKMMVLRDEKVDWCRTDEIKIGDSILLDISERWHGFDLCYADQDWAKKDAQDKIFHDYFLTLDKETFHVYLCELFKDYKVTGIEYDYLRKIQYALLHFGIISILKKDSLEISKEDYETRLLNNIENNQKIAYSKITKIEDVQAYTVDLNVPSNNTYCANGFISHNTGEKIRGQRANDIMIDEFASLNIEIFENVIAGFAAVTANPADNVKRVAAKTLKKMFGIESFHELMEEHGSASEDNQIILAGTAYYKFNHFYSYYTKWKNIIKTAGDQKKLAELFPDKKVPKSFNWKNYSIVRIPYDVAPPGFMDEDQITRSKATINAGIFGMEFGASFSSDSNGFFRRSLVELCTVKPDRPISLPLSGDVMFHAITEGSPDKKYIYGIDPASEVDNFSIVVLECHQDHRRIVYCWTTNREKQKEIVKANLTKETDYYAFCARKIRELMKVFPCEGIAIDSQGGGIAVIEALHDLDKLEEGELPIWEVIDYEKPKDTDSMVGLHLIHKINFVNPEFTSDSNYGLKKDFEDRVLLFPYFDAMQMAIEGVEENIKNKIYDTYEDCVFEIEDLKDELALITLTQTPSGRDHWDTPEVKLPGSKKGRMRKDRYSALLMANYIARNNMRILEKPKHIFYGGGFAGTQGGVKESTGQDYIGPSWWTSKMNGVYR